MPKRIVRLTLLAVVIALVALVVVPVASARRGSA